jgi:Tfp pilus assembly protein PilX
MSIQYQHTSSGLSLTHRGSARLQPGRGSAYIITLLVLVVLSLIGHTLIVVTETEMQIGGNQRVSQRVFYGSDSGINLATARVLTVADNRPRTYTIQESQSALLLDQQVDVSAFYPILDAPCNLCEINDAGTYSDKAYRKINHAVTSVAQRDPARTSARTRAAKSISAMMEFQPWRSTPAAYAPIQDPDLLAKIKF